MKTSPLLMGLISFALTVSALASGIEASIPFPFRAGSRDLPAGTYSISKNERSDALYVRGGPTEIIVPITTRLSGPSNPLDFEGTLAFDRKDQLYVLSEVWVPSEEGFQVGSLEGAHAHVLVHVVPRTTESMSADKIFGQTCQICHGPGGRGNADADKFFKKRLPRLNSATVQSKTDDELRLIITRGKGSMDPVRLQTSDGMRHALPAGAVDPLIAYLRTLASKT